MGWSTVPGTILKGWTRSGSSPSGLCLAPYSTPPHPTLRRDSRPGSGGRRRALPAVGSLAPDRARPQPQVILEERDQVAAPHQAAGAVAGARAAHQPARDELVLDAAEALGALRQALGRRPSGAPRRRWPGRARGRRTCWAGRPGTGRGRSGCCASDRRRSGARRRRAPPRAPAGCADRRDRAGRARPSAPPACGPSAAKLTSGWSERQLSGSSVTESASCPIGLGRRAARVEGRHRARAAPSTATRGSGRIDPAGGVGASRR